MNHASSVRRPFDWLRVGAWSGSFAAHAGILALIALPMTVPPARPVAQAIVARWIEMPPAPPEIAEPPPPKAPPRAHHATPAAMPAAALETEANTPAPPLPGTESQPAAETTATSVSTTDRDIGAGGTTQTLAYATPMHPRYPPASVRAHEQGAVVLRVLVDASGVPQRIEIARGSGHPALDAAARESVSQARFRPVMRDGEAVAAWGLVPIVFRLDRG